MIIEYLNLIGDLKNTRLKVEVEVEEESSRELVFTAEGMIGEYILDKNSGKVKSNRGMIIGREGEIVSK